MDLDEKKTRLQIMKMDTNILEYEVKIDERNEDIKRIEAQIELCKKSKQELQEQLNS
jgi:predicted  nucleic acid-binding Zn-ribbon protein